jgi:hypothetical protein
MIRIYADFNHRDAEGRVVLDTVGSLADLKEQEEMLAEGMDVLLYMEDEFEVEGTLIFDEVWLAIPRLSTLRYLDPKDGESEIDRDP